MRKLAVVPTLAVALLLPSSAMAHRAHHGRTASSPFIARAEVLAAREVDASAKEWDTELLPSTLSESEVEPGGPDTASITASHFYGCEATGAREARCDYSDDYSDGVRCDDTLRVIELANGHLLVWSPDDWSPDESACTPL